MSKLFSSSTLRENHNQQTFGMLFCRTILFTIHESPAWLIGVGRCEEALTHIQAIARANGKDLTLTIDDVKDLEGEAEPMEQRNYDGSRPNSPQVYTEKLRIPLVPAFAQPAVSEYVAKMEKLFARDWRLTTILVWSIWGIVSAAYT